MSEILIQASQFVLSLSILIVLHELGHFIPAKIFKTRVEKFYLFFDPWFSLFKKKIGETEYGIGWLPLGGYVKIAGMIDESMDTEQMQSEPQPWEFRSKPAWQRLIIMVGGVTVNILLAMFIYAMVLFTWGQQYLPNDNVKDGVMVLNDSIGYSLGIQNGDKILAVDGQKIDKFTDTFGAIVVGDVMTIERDNKLIEQEIPTEFIGQLVESNSKGAFLYPRMPFMVGGLPDSSRNVNSGLQAKDRIIAIGGEDLPYFDMAQARLKELAGQTTTTTVDRDGQQYQYEVEVSPEGKLEVSVAFLSIEDMSKLGLYELESREYGFFESFPAGINMAWTRLVDYVKQFKKIVNPETGAYKGLGGFMSMGNLFPPVWDWQVFWNLTAFLSIMLGFLNILPIPALDGGHVVFLLFEMVSGKKPSEKVLEYAQIAGFVVLMSLVLLANGNDIIRFFFN